MKSKRQERHLRHKRHRRGRPVRALARGWRVLAHAWAFAAMGGCAAWGVAQAAEPVAHRRLSPEADPALDRSGHTRVGKASFYSNTFAGRTMADGTPMKPTGDNAASRTLPLGTTAKVTNLATGKTAIVTIRDRGPFIAGRIVDLSPATARQIGLTKRKGVTKVEVAPIAVPLANGEIKLGDGVLQARNWPEGGDPAGAQPAETGLP